MNEISLDLTDRLEEVLSWKNWIQGNIDDEFDEHKFYTTIFDSSSITSPNIEETSILNILVLLGVKPNRDSDYLTTKFNFYDARTGIPKSISDTEEFFDQALASMIEFVNVSTYLYGRLGYVDATETQSKLLKFLLVAVSSIYEELYSSRGKIEFAYYFKKLLQHNDDIQTEITPYNRESWRGDFSKYTRQAKQEIDSLLSNNSNKNSVSITIFNLYLTVGKETDQNILPLEKRYFIEMGVAHEDKTPEQIFITNFL